MILCFEDKKVELVDVWFKYLYSYLIRFCISKKIGIEWKNDIICIPNIYKQDFIILLKKIFEELMNECYVEPTQKQLSKNSSRYKKVTYYDRMFRLNYRTDIVGIIGYGLHYLIMEFESDESNN